MSPFPFANRCFLGYTLEYNKSRSSTVETRFECNHSVQSDSSRVKGVWPYVEKL